MAARHTRPAPNSQQRSHKPESLNHLLSFTLPPRQTQQLQALPRRSRRTGNNHGVFNKERFVNAQYRFVMNPEGDYTVHFADPDIFFQWHDVLQIIIPRNSALASIAGGGGHVTDEGHTTCPICLAPPTAPRMTKCGHVFCFPCILHYFSTGENPKWARCPICFDSITENALKAVQWFEGPPQLDDEPSPAQASSSSSSFEGPDVEPRPGSMLRMRLMQRPQITTLALPRSSTWPSDLLPPHQAPFHFLPDVQTFAKFMLATPAQLIAALEQDLREVLAERRSLQGLDDPISLTFVEAAETRLHQQIAKAAALDTVPLRNAVDKALQIQHSLEARATYHQRRLQEQRQVSQPATENVAEAYAVTKPPIVTVAGRNQKSRRNLNPPPPSTSTYYFYQAASGIPAFLHPLDIRILHAHFADYASFPDTINLRVEALSEGAVDGDLRKRCKYLAHMPEGADVVFVEADLVSVVGEVALRPFEGALKARRAKRESKVRKDDRARVKAEEREREKVAQVAWYHTGMYEPPPRAPTPLVDETEEVQASAPHEISGTWGARSFASAMRTGTPEAPRLREEREEVDEWDLDAAWHEMEQRSAGGGGRRRKGRMVVLGNGPGRRR
ncbi:hypothetical protein K488DRAFT_50525 [Vararia minispora EC-137]|uniref:Uncharacterized protein n=1 Tax=Vararia minispora EC-137 TaxID=1314806 RepID=A0ACB8QLF3_9AGAM|nr:hypothetical protein K488DRAFT_50525 [Vararia minispora EC-137]